MQSCRFSSVSWRQNNTAAVCVGKSRSGGEGLGCFWRRGGCRDLVKMQGEKVEGEEKEEEEEEQEEDGDGTDSKGQPRWMAGKMKE